MKYLYLLPSFGLLCSLMNTFHEWYISAGEDGFVKVWSRNGLLRSTIVHSDLPCYSAVWSPDSSAILYTKGNFLVIKQLNSNTKITKVSE